MNIFYFAYDHQKPTGGQKSVYRHVDILNHNGFSAFILHSREEYRLSWFANTTAIVGPAAFRERYNVNEDIIVLPEDLGSTIVTYPGSKVIINQGPYLGFYAYGFKAPKQYPYLDPSVRAVIVKSEHSAGYLRFAYPRQKIVRVFNGDDAARFPFRPKTDKKRIIAAPPNKNTMDLAQVFNILMSRSQQNLNNLGSWAWSFIEDRSEQDVARILGDAAIFMFLSTIEGFGRLPIEAMLSGCLVAAYDIPPLTEYLSNGNALLSPRGDVVDVVERIEKAVNDFEEGEAAWAARMRASRISAEAFSLEREDSSVIAAWRQILS